MKKLMLAFLLAASVLLPVMGQDKNRSELYYRSAPIYKVMDSKEAYIVVFGKYGSKMGTIKIPKEWSRNLNGEQKKLLVRKLPPNTTPFVTVITKSGEFHKVMLTVPIKHSDPLWGIAVESKVGDLDDPKAIVEKVQP